MADQVTATDKTPEEIELEMLRTRESLTEKVAALEGQVMGTVQNAADTISGTVDAVKSMVAHAPDTVKQAMAAVGDTMRESFDVTAQVRQHPLAAVGVSALVGCLVGWLSASGRRHPGNFDSLAKASPPVSAPPRGAPVEQPGVLDEVVAMLGDKVKELARTAVETGYAAVKENIQTNVPKLVDDATNRLVEPGAEVNRAPLAYHGSRI